MKKFLLVLTVIILAVSCSSVSFAYNQDEARDAMITYSGTDAFLDLLPEERQACMIWVSEGGRMSEICRSAVTRLLSQDPNAVTPSQRRALLAAASGGTARPSAHTTRPSGSGTVIRKGNDNTGAVIAAGIVGIIAGMVIHNNWPRDRDCRPHYRPGPPPPYYHPRPHYRPAPPRICRPSVPVRGVPVPVRRPSFRHPPGKH